MLKYDIKLSHTQTILHQGLLSFVVLIAVSLSRDKRSMALLSDHGQSVREKVTVVVQAGDCVFRDYLIGLSRGSQSKDTQKSEHWPRLTHIDKMGKFAVFALRYGWARISP